MERPYQAYRGDDAYVFVSYSHQDNEIVYPGLQWLRDQGFNVWYDEGISPGASWREELAQALLKCDLFIILVSPRSATSEHCLKEVNFALEHHRPILAIHLEKTTLTPGLQLALSDRQAILQYELNAEQFREKVLAGISSYIPQGEPGTTTTGFGAKRRSGSMLAMIATTALFLVAIGFGVAWYMKASKSVPPAKTPVPPTQTSRPENAASVRSNWIAVLPFSTLTDSNEARQLSRGITTEIISKLAPVGFFIVPWSSVEKYQSQAPALDDIAHTLNVRYVVNGTIQQASDKVRIGVELDDAVQGKSLWQDSFTYPAADLLKVQDEVTLQTVRVLSTRMIEFEQARLSTVPPENLTAKDLTMLSSKFFLDPNPTTLATAIENVRRAVKLDPNLAGAHASLAQLLEITLLVGFAQNQQSAKDEACRAADRAVLLGRNQPGAALVVIYPLVDICKEPDTAIEFGKRATSASPEYAGMWPPYAAALSANGDEAGALAAFDKAESLDPNAVWVRYLVEPLRAIAYGNAGNYKHAIPIARQALSADPSNFWLRMTLAGYLTMTGDATEARTQWQLVKKQFPTVSLDQYQWYLKQSMMPKEKVDHLVSSLLQAGVEAEASQTK